MKRFFIGSSLILSALFPPIQGNAQSPDFEELVWADEFNEGTKPNASNWIYEEGDGCPTLCGWGNNEEQIYTSNSQNVRLENGNLIIEARHEGGVYTSGRIKTEGKRSFKYGRIEVRAKLPSGKGTWPAIWMLGNNINEVGWPASGEIDIMEYVGYQPGKVHSSLHTPSSYGGTVNTAEVTVNNAESAFNLYAIEWDADKIRFFVNDNNFYTYQPTKSDDTWPFDQEAFLILNLAIGGNWGGAQGIDDSIFPQRFEVDYVRVYQKFSGEVAIQAPEFLQAGQQSVAFSATKLTGASYEWILPDGVTIVEGAGSSDIKVNWGDQAGTVKVKITHNGQIYEAEQQVSVKVNPTEAYALPIGIENWEVPAEFSDQLAVTALDGLTQIEFDVEDPSANPYLLLNLPQPVNMETFHKLSVKLKTTEAPETLRIDLLDTEGKATASDEIFKLHPLNTDGEKHDYIHYFEPTFDISTLDRSSIHQLKMYVNYSWLASAATGSLQIESMIIDNPEADDVPAAPSEFTGNTLENSSAVQLSWTDLAANEKGYQLFRQSPTQQNPVVIAEALPVDAAGYTDVNVKSNTMYTYSLVAYNQFGESSLVSLDIKSGQAVLASEGEINTEIVVYPNPVSDEFQVHCPEATTVSLFTLSGKLLKEVRVTNGEYVSIADIPSGMYILRMKSARINEQRRLLKL